MQPRSEPVACALIDFDAVRRPAAPVERLRHAATQHATRILLLRGSGEADNDEKIVRRWLQIAGLQAVLLPEDELTAITTARPDCVILCGTIGAAATDAIDKNASVMTATDLASANDKIAMLASLLPQRLPKGDDR